MQLSLLVFWSWMRLTQLNFWYNHRNSLYLWLFCSSFGKPIMQYMNLNLIENLGILLCLGSKKQVNCKCGKACRMFQNELELTLPQEEKQLCIPVQKKFLVWVADTQIKTLSSHSSTSYWAASSKTMLLLWTKTWKKVILLLV